MPLFAIPWLFMAIFVHQQEKKKRKKIT